MKPEEVIEAAELVSFVHALRTDITSLDSIHNGEYCIPQIFNTGMGRIGGLSTRIPFPEMKGILQRLLDKANERLSALGVDLPNKYSKLKSVRLDFPDNGDDDDA